MQTKPSPGRHRKPSAARTIAARTAVSTGAAAAAVLLAGGTATAATASADTTDARTVVSESNPTAPPCTNTPLDAVIGPLAQTNCNDPAPEAPDDVTGDDPTEQGGNDSGSGSGSDERGGQPAAPGVPFPGGNDGGNPPGA